ncbi:MAG: hypothetical protein DYH08_15095 [Actinobacteria bacterium ATB1]|nr:hypothetical protein [Actinobacteria bacterium ATB1]
MGVFHLDRRHHHLPRKHDHHLDPHLHSPSRPCTLEAGARDTASLYDPTPASVDFTLGEPPEGRPDIVPILTDDQRFDTLPQCRTSTLSSPSTV